MSSFLRTFAFSLFAAVFAVWFVSAPAASAANATWNGTTSGVWATTTNWSASPVPGTGNTATFNNAGSLNTTLDLGAGVSLLSITFDTGTAAGYTLGSGGVGSQTLTLETGGVTKLTSTVGNHQTINANVLLGVSAVTSSYTFTNDSLSKTLTVAGSVSGNTGGTAAAKTLTVNGAGNTTISGAISNGGATTLGLTKNFGAGTLTLSGNNSYTGATLIGAQGGISGGSVLLSGSGKLGTGAVTLYEGILDLNNTTQTINGLTVGGGSSVSAASVFIGSGALNLGGNVGFTGLSNHVGAVISGSGGGVINLLGNRTFQVGHSNIASDDLTISAIIANGDLTARGITKAGSVFTTSNAGVLTLNAANTFTGATSIAANGGTLKLDFAASNAPTSNILYNTGTAAALNIAVGTAASSTLLVQGKSGTTNSQAFGNLTQTGGSGLASITVNSGSSGTMNLSLGTITRAVGSSIAFTGPASGSITTTQANGRIEAATYSSGAGVTTWAQVASGTVGAYTGDTLYAGGNIVSNASANLYINNTTSGNVTQTSGTTNLATLSMLDAADRTVAVGAGNAILLSGPSGGVQNISTAGNLTIGTLGSAGSITAGTTGAHEFIITNGSTNNTLTINSAITNNALGSPILNITGPGRIVLTGSNTYTGATNLNGGILEIQNNSALGTTAGSTLIAQGATLGLSGGITTAEGITINGSGAGNGGALRNISGTNTVSGNVTVGSASRINSDAGLLAFSGSFTNGSGLGLTFGGAGDTALATSISPVANAFLNKDGNGTLTLLASGIVNGSGAVTVSAGTLRYGANDAMGTGNLTVNGGTFDLSTFSDSVGTVTLSAGSIIGSGTLTGTGVTQFTGYLLTDSGMISANLGNTNATLTKTGNGTATLAGTSAYTGATNINSGVLNITGSMTGGTAIFIAGVSGGVGGTGSITQSASSVISGTSSILWAGNMALVTSSTLAGNNSYTGLTTINMGVLRVLHSNALGAIAAGTSVANGAALELAGDISIGAEALTLAGSGISNGGVLRNISGSNSYAGAISMGSGTTRINSDAGTLTLTGGLTSTNQPLIIGGAGNTNVTNTIALGNGALTKDGTGIVTLTGSNTYTGATTVSGGILTIGKTSAKGSGTVTSGTAGSIGLGVGGTGYYSSANVDSLFANTLTGFTMNAASGVGIDTSAGDFAYATNQNAARSLTKLGANALTLTGTSAYTGATVVHAGTLIVAGSLTNTSNTAVLSGATLKVNGSVNSAVSVSGVLSGTGTVGAVTVASGGTLAPGNSAGVLNVSSLTGTSGAVLSMEIGKSGLNPVAGTDYDQVNSSGGVTLGGMTLNLTPVGGAVALGDKIFLVLNGSGVVGGIFDGLAQGAVFSLNSQDYQISYLADWTGNYATSSMLGGNDVAILAVPEPSTCLLLGLGLMVHVLRRRRKTS